MDPETPELVVLVDDTDTEIGTMPKSEVHTMDTPLHRAFSAFLFKDGKLLLQQRSHKKKTWPLMWSNSVCGHPLPGEERADAVVRRASFELGLSIADVQLAAPYRYRFEREGVVENEICPIFLASIISEPELNLDEVEAMQWLTWSEFMAELSAHPDDWSEWCREEAAILDSLKLLQDYTT